MKKQHYYWLLGLVIVFCLQSCSSSKDFYSQSSVPAEIKHYLEKDNVFNEDFISNRITKVDSSYTIKLSQPYWLIPTQINQEEIPIGKSNNNVSIAIHQKRIYVAFRTGPYHFASKKAGVYVLSSADGQHWEKELELFIGRDIREPFLMSLNGKLHFYYFTAGQSIAAFEPKKIEHFVLDEEHCWIGPEEVLTEGEVHWSLKKRNSKVYMTSYKGAHYNLKGPSSMELHFKKSKDGKNFAPIKQDKSTVYFGGASECAFEFDYEGNLWAVTRLEDGDETGFGSHVAYADKDNLDQWEFPDSADARCFMSPKMFNHNNDLYLIARKQLGKHKFGRTPRDKSMRTQRLRNWVSYSLSAKTTALYKINKLNKRVEWLMDLPGAGDTAFPSIVRLSQDKFLVANYSSPTNRHQKRSWLNGQFGKTGIYLMVIEFVPQLNEQVKRIVQSK